MAQHFSPVLVQSLCVGFLSLMTLGCSTAATSNNPQPTVSQTPSGAEAQPVQKTKADLKETPSEKPETPIAQAKPSAKPTSAPAPKIEVPNISQDKIISSVNSDWNGDGILDRAILLVASDPTETDLLIYLSDASKQPKLVLNKKNVAWRGAMYGTQPSLALNSQGSLLINSANDAIGRNRWNKTITALYENGEFVVAGYTYSYRDTLDLAAHGNCDVNLLTGKGVKNDKEFRTTLKPMNLEDWTENTEPKECQ